jgi:ribosome-binding protein aMBF1 (putative translation factor)
MKTRRTKAQEIRLQVGRQKPRLYLVPQDRAESVVRLLETFEVNNNDEEGTVPWQTAVQELVDKYSLPGASLRGARMKENLSQTAVAAKLGIPPSNISEMESGKRPIGKAMAKRLAKVLRIDYRVFL